MQYPARFLQMPPTNQGHGHRSEDYLYAGDTCIQKIQDIPID